MNANTPDAIKVGKASKKVSYNWPVVGLLLFMSAVPGLPALYFVTQLLIGPPSDGSDHTVVAMHYFNAQLPLIIHGLSGFVFFITVPFQFSPALRAKHLGWHKATGKVGICSAYMLALSGVWIINFVSIDPSIPKYTGFVAISIGMLITFSLGLKSIKDRRVEQHRAWMMRGVAIPLGGVTPLLLSIPIIAIYGNLDAFYPGLSYVEANYDRWLGMGINLLVVECILFRERIKARGTTVFSVAEPGDLK